MATAYYNDGIDIRFRQSIGQFETLAQAKAACIDHAKAHRAFVSIIAAEDDGNKGFDMAVQVGSQVRLYFADA